MTFPVDEFVAAWRLSRNTADAARRLGMSEKGARLKAKALRARGVRLKAFKAGRPPIGAKR